MYLFCWKIYNLYVCVFGNLLGPIPYPELSTVVLFYKASHSTIEKLTYKKVSSSESDNLVVFYHPSASEILLKVELNTLTITDGL